MSVGPIGARAAFACAGVVSAMAFGAVSASAESATFTMEGCETWEVPAGVSSVGISAVGAAGGSSPSGDEELRGGTGDGVSATLAVSGGQTLDVCVDDEPTPIEFFNEFGLFQEGGGASGVSVGSTFASPVLVAGAGGGAGSGDEGVEDRSHGGNAGLPEGSPGGGENQGGGGGGTQEHGGSGGPRAVEGSCFTASGPGRGGEDATFELPPNEPVSQGGTGGGGYCGGGGGGEAQIGYGGGGGGSDFCTETAAVTACTVSSGAGTGTVAGSAPGDAQVTLTYTVPPACAAVSGVGHVLPKGKEGENLHVHLTTSGGTFRTTTLNGAAAFALTHLNSASCVATAGGYEFSGQGPAKMRRVNGYEMAFSFATEGGNTYLSLEVTKGATVYSVTDALLTKGSKVKIS